MSRRKPLAALAALTAATALAIPAAGVSAARPLRHKPSPSGLSPAATAQTCQIMGAQGQKMSVFANPVYNNAQHQLGTMNGCL